MTKVYITIDTEYSAGLYQRFGKDGRQKNSDMSVMGRTPSGDVGIGYQLETFDRYGLKAVFFVDPMPALIWGTGAIADIVEPILKRGHDVQLHLHSEWLEFAGKSNPLGDQTGKNIKDFGLEDQIILIEYAMQSLIDVGAPKPVAFRAGNYGANDDTLRALHRLGITYDTSHAPGIATSDCEISLNEEQRAPIEHCGVTEVPVGSIAAMGGGQRHAQITALSASEMLAASRHAHSSGASQFTLVSHSFELLSRDRRRINKIVTRRFEKFCVALAGAPNIATATYANDPPTVTQSDTSSLLPHSMLRTGFRMAQQALSNQLYGAE